MSLGFHVSIGVGSPGLGPNVASASFSCSIFLPSPFPSRHFFLSPTTDFTITTATCCVETCLIDCYLKNSGLYVHESCCLGVQRRLPTYESCSGFQDGHETSMKQMWCRDLRDTTCTTDQSQEPLPRNHLFP